MKLLIICGPTATGKTDLALSITSKLSGEIVSADSRQVYSGMDIVTGKDIPTSFNKVNSTISWRDNNLPYYTNNSVRIWLTDVVKPNDQFNLSFFHECATKIIQDIKRRGKLPIVVGATGLYIRSLLENLKTIHIPINPQLRNSLSHKDASYLFDYLNKINPSKAVSLNMSDSQNPRRLIRAIEVSLHKSPVSTNNLSYDSLIVGLNAREELVYQKIDARVLSRIKAGAQKEVETLLSQGYEWSLPSMQTSGYMVWRDCFSHKLSTEELVSAWQTAEHHDYKQQLAYFKKWSQTNWIDVENSDWKSQAETKINAWYNSL